MQYYIDTKATPKSKVIKILGKEIGVNYAQSTVEYWFSIYDEFYFDMKLHDVVFYKKRGYGYCDTKSENLNKFIIEDVEID